MADKAKILLVDDRDENLVALEAILSSLDQELVSVQSGEAALKALLTDEFAVILLDVVMPGMDGFETATHIKRRVKTRDIPIIFLTAVSREPHHTFRGYAAGAVDYVAKPFDPWLLRSKVGVFVDLYRKNQRLKQQAELLRRRLDDSTDGPSADTLVTQLSEGLNDIECQAKAVADALSDHPAPDAVPPAIPEAVTRLEDRIARLRTLLSAIEP